jgi:adenylate cyclase
MAADEAGTLAALKQHRETLFDPAVAANNGRIVKLIGDGALVEFASVVDAVNCALAIQKAIAADASDTRKLTLRIGVNLGDVIIDGDDIYGDGVNVAARLEPLAEPGGICIASIVNESVGTRIDDRFEDGGEVSVKNIDRPIRVWRWRPGAATVATTGNGKPAAVAAPKSPAKAAPSIAVLPFTNMSGEAEQEYFSDGITEDIITDLSKIAGLVVIARNSSFTYKGRHVDIRTVGQELGVSSVLEGSIRRAGNRVRITAQLIDAGNGAHLWAERYDRDLTDIFAVQDDVTREIVSALKVTLTPDERIRLVAPANAGTSNAEALDAVLRARNLLAQPYTKDVFDRSIALLGRAIELDREYAQAYAALAMAHSFDYQNRWTADPDGALQTSKTYAEIALAKDPNDAFAHYVAGVTVAYLGERQRALAEFDRALELSPNFALAIVAKGVAAIFNGQVEEGIPLIERAIRLDPGSRSQSLHFLGLANLVLKRFETAAAQFQERILLTPETDLSRALLASTLGHLGRVDEARAAWRNLMVTNPNYSFEQHAARLIFLDPEALATIRDGLARAGLPD